MTMCSWNDKSHKLCVDMCNNGCWREQQSKPKVLKLKAGMPLVTKYPNTYGNAVVYSVLGDDNSKRNPVRILTDFGHLMIFPSVEDVLFYWDICPNYKYAPDNMKDDLFSLRERLNRQIELLTEVREGLN